MKDQEIINAFHLMWGGFSRTGNDYPEKPGKKITSQGFIQKSIFDSDNYVTINVRIKGREGFHGERN